MVAENNIGSSPCPNCMICGGTGEILHFNQRDLIFGAPGQWILKRCPSEECRLVWLDPMPTGEDIGKAYARYYTHTASAGDPSAGMPKRTYMAIKRQYLASKYHYRQDPERLRIPGLGSILYLLPLRRANADGDVRFLHAVPAGRLLDVGCGSGDWLISMRALGWNVTGVEVDVHAANVGRSRGITIVDGQLETQNFPGDTFDAITLNHVIEHLHDPVRTLMECARILKPGGKLVLFTPNGESLGHRLYGQYWRGLEPPRHLHIFSPQSTRRAFELAGFTGITILPWVATSIIYESHLLHAGWRGPFADAHRQWWVHVLARTYSALELVLMSWKPSIADCLAAIAIK
jgi:2-polyprenyl-3-methyl-5-hydroxy-6-metoxy-1,4-benzoquinol methylase